MWENKAGKKQLVLEVTEDWKCETKNYWEKSVCSNVGSSNSSPLLVKSKRVSHCVCECTRGCVFDVFRNKP